MTGLTWFGLATLAGMLVCYANESRGRAFILGFSACCAGASVYGFVAGTWPFGLVEAIWAAVAIRRWRQAGPPAR